MLLRLWIQHQDVGEAFSTLRNTDLVLSTEDLLHHYFIGKLLPTGFELFVTLERFGLAQEILFPEEIRKRCQLISEKDKAEYRNYIDDIPEQATTLYLDLFDCPHCNRPICDTIFQRTYGLSILECILLPPKCWYNYGENIFLSKEIRLALTSGCIVVCVDVEKKVILCCVKVDVESCWSGPYVLGGKILLKVFCKSRIKMVPSLFNLASVRIIQTQHDNKVKLTQKNLKPLLPQPIIRSIQILEHLHLRFMC